MPKKRPCNRRELRRYRNPSKEVDANGVEIEGSEKTPCNRRELRRYRNPRKELDGLEIQEEEDEFDWEDEIEEVEDMYDCDEDADELEDDSGYDAFCPNNVTLTVTCTCDAESDVEYFLPNSDGMMASNFANTISCEVFNPDNGKFLEYTTSASKIALEDMSFALSGTNMVARLYDGSTGPEGMPREFPNTMIHTGLMEGSYDPVTLAVAYTKLEGETIYPCNAVADSATEAVLEKPCVPAPDEGNRKLRRYRNPRKELNEGEVYCDELKLCACEDTQDEGNRELWRYRNPRKDLNGEVVGCECDEPTTAEEVTGEVSEEVLSSETDRCVDTQGEGNRKLRRCRNPRKDLNGEVIGCEELEVKDPCAEPMDEGNRELRRYRNPRKDLNGVEIECGEAAPVVPSPADEGI